MPERLGRANSPEHNRSWISRRTYPFRSENESLRVHSTPIGCNYQYLMSLNLLKYLVFRILLFLLETRIEPASKCIKVISTQRTIIKLKNLSLLFPISTNYIRLCGVLHHRCVIISLLKNIQTISNINWVTAVRVHTGS
jgi:hypothetical protein